MTSLNGPDAHRLRTSGWRWFARLSPFGLGHRKPKHFRDMLGVLWRNRDNLPHAWRVLSRGVCDGCALGVAGFHDWTIPGVHLCMTRLNLLRLNTVPALDPSLLEDVGRLRGRDNAALRELGRIPFPVRRLPGESGFRRVSWDEALGQLGGRIRRTDPSRVAFFVTARGVTNEVYYMAQKAARFIGTNNVDNAARLCHAPSTVAMKEMLGVAASTCSYQDWIESDLILFFGSNPANDQPVATKYLLLARQRGARVVLVNPYLEPGMRTYWVPSTAGSALFGSDLATHWFPVRPGGDVAFLTGVARCLLERGAVDEAFIRESTVGVELLRAAVCSTPWETLEKDSGLPRRSIEGFADLVQGASRGVVVWSMGITQSPSGADGVRMILNLALLRGWIGRNGCGAMPIRGHSSVQGGAEMGCYATALPGGVPIHEENCAALERAYGFPIPRTAGLTTTEMVEQAARGAIDYLHLVGGNLLRTLPEPERVRAALRRPAVRVHQDIILTDSMLEDSDGEVWLLPAKTRYEQDGGGVETSTERRVMFSPEIPRRVGEARAEWIILRDLAAAAFPERADRLGGADGFLLREEIARVVPFYAGVEKLRTTGDAFQYGGRHLCAGGLFPLPQGKARFTAPPLPSAAPRPGFFHLSTRRGKQFNTLVYAEVDPLNGASRDAVLMNAEDAARLHLVRGDRVRLTNDLGTMECRVFPAPIAPGSLQVHWPEGNHLLPRESEERSSRTPSYTAEVRIEVPEA